MGNEFSRVPKDVFKDIRLSGNDCLIYTALSMFQGRDNTAEIGVRKLMKVARLSRGTIVGGLKRLEQCGYIKKLVMGWSFGSKARGTVYEFTHPMFGRKQGVDMGRKAR